MKRKGFLLIALIFVALAGAGAYAWQSKKTPLPQGARTAEAEGMRFEIADTPDKRELGLGNRAEIPDDFGMLFVFPEKKKYGFWMKDMIVPIDIIWLDDDGTILLIDHAVSPATYPEVLYPPLPVKYVLETQAGYTQKKGWDVGTKVTLPHLQ